MTRKIRWGSSLEAHRQYLEACEKAKQNAKPKRKPKKKKAAKAEKTPMTYLQYINSKAWRHVRRQAVNHHGRKCNRCGSTESLHVHHKTYERLGREKMKDLEILCSGCHANHHEGQVFGSIDPMTREYLDLGI